MKRALMLATAAWLAAGAARAAGEIDFVEDFALARDRAAVLKTLIPSTEDFYYYHCLHYLNTQQFEKARQMTGPWLQRFGQTSRLNEIQLRHALLVYDREPRQSLDFLRDRLRLRFDHERVVPGAVPQLPTSLDQAVISREKLLERSFAGWTNLDNIEPAGLDWIATQPLNEERRRHLLSLLARPDAPNLVKHLLDDLATDDGKPFGSLAIHHELTSEQRRQCLEQRPGLLTQSAFVQDWLQRLQPSSDEAWRNDPAKTKAYLERLQEFVRRLPPNQNSLKAHVIYHRLAFDRSRGVYDRGLFIEYLKLPRSAPYLPEDFLERAENRRNQAQLGEAFGGITLLAPVGSDEPLVRSYLLQFLKDTPTPPQKGAARRPAEAAEQGVSVRDFEPYVHDVYLREVFAEAKIVNGLGEPDQWASLLPPERYRAIKDRVDIDFAHTNENDFQPDDPVALDVDVKNVSSLLVKVFEINTVNFYRTQEKEVNTDVNLDGLVANEERTLKFDEAPVRRMRRRIDFPALNRAGVFVIDLIGNGRNSRALIRKGRVRPLPQTTNAGQRLTFVDQAGRKVDGVRLWMGGQQYDADQDGAVMLPFTTSPGRRQVVVAKDGVASLDHLDLEAEQYSLAAGIHVDRESLIGKRLATLLLRGRLTVNGRPVSTKRLEKIRLKIETTDSDGLDASREEVVANLPDDRETLHEFRVPPRTCSLTATLRAEVKSLVTGKLVPLSASETFRFNAIDKTERIEALQLAKAGGRWFAELVGRTGEPRVDRAVSFEIKHRFFKEPVRVQLKTDARGRVDLGPLADVDWVQGTPPESETRQWTLDAERSSYHDIENLRAGQTVQVPFFGPALDPAEVALFELRGGHVRADRFKSLTLVDGMLKAEKLEAGDYELWLKRQNRRLKLHVADGPVVGGFIVGAVRHLETPPAPPIQLAPVEVRNDAVVIRLLNASPYARVHVFATRYAPAFDAFADLARIGVRNLSGRLPSRPTSVYVTGRNIGDEYRYVLDRKHLKPFPGVMLERPSLLLNPWMVRTTETAEQLAAQGDAFAPAPAPASSATMGRSDPDAAAQKKAEAVAGGDFANLDYLAEQAALGLNLAVDKNGVVRVPVADLGPHSMIRVVACDTVDAVQRTFELPDRSDAPLDLRLRDIMDPSKNFTQKSQATVVEAGKTFELADAGSSRYEVYDSLAKVFAVYRTLSHDAKLNDFEFLLDWPHLSTAEKRANYSRRACHELNYFLFRKDAEFFRTVVKPYLADKKDKTFLDRWLLEEPLDDQRTPWRYDQLNAVERVLLGQRLAGERDRVSRLLKDQLNLKPVDDELHDRLFRVVIGQGEITEDAQRMVREEVRLGAELGLQDRALVDKKLLDQDARRAPADASGFGLRGGGGLGGGLGGGGGQRPQPARSRAGRMLGREAAKSDVAAKDDAGPASVDYFMDGSKAMAKAKQLYRPVDKTEEYAENNYDRLPIGQQNGDLVAPDAYWLDYARHGEGAFLSRSFPQATHGFTEMMFALATIDLPFSAAKHQTTFNGAKLTFTPGSRCIVFHEEIRPAVKAADKSPITVSANFYRHGDRYRNEDGEQRDKFVTGEYVARTVYGCQVVVSNLSSQKQRLTVLTQIPKGALPIKDTTVTRAHVVALEPYRTSTIDYLFYFPMPGKFEQFPANVAKDDRLVAAADATVFDVLAAPSKLDVESWDYVSQNGTDDQVIAFLQRENVHALDLERIAFRMKDAGMFARVTALLADRHVWQATLWSYGFVHQAPAQVQEYLRHRDDFVAQLGGPIAAPILDVEPVARREYEHLEYRPVVNARAHSLGQRRQIVNDRILFQHQRFMKLLGYHGELGDDDLLTSTYYLLLQDRYDEALGLFARVNAGRLATRMQYDYAATWLALLAEDAGRARTIAAKYADHPVDRWRDLFNNALRQIDEIEGRAGKASDSDDRDVRQGAMAADEPGLDFTVEARTVKLNFQNLRTVRVNYYLMDVELLFSRSPFVQSGRGQFASIRPNESQEVALPADKGHVELPLPGKLADRNVLVEIVGGPVTRTQTWYANSMQMRMIENYGQVRVTDADGKSLPKTYVKVYARTADGQVKFHKDGYTDLRGKFDYASVSTPLPSPIEKFAVLVLSDDKGAAVKEAAPPQQ